MTVEHGFLIAALVFGIREFGHPVYHRMFGSLHEIPLNGGSLSELEQPKMSPAIAQRVCPGGQNRPQLRSTGID